MHACTHAYVHDTRPSPRRVVANGDTANKIGTYSLSIAAKHHGVPFFIAAPTTTIDPDLETGEAIHIEQRPPEEASAAPRSVFVVPGGRAGE